METDLNQRWLLENQLVHDRFAEFERGVLQDNIVLCDSKSGVLLAFSGAMVIFCIDAFIGVHNAANAAHLATKVLLLLSALAFLVSCHFSLTTVLPRLRRGHDDHIFWESKVFHLSASAYVEHMENLNPEIERREKLTHLHMLAGICRNKFAHFLKAIRLAQLAFVLLVAGELTRFFG